MIVPTAGITKGSGAFTEPTDSLHEKFSQPRLQATILQPSYYSTMAVLYDVGDMCESDCILGEFLIISSDLLIL